MKLNITSDGCVVDFEDFDIYIVPNWQGFRRDKNRIWFGFVSIGWWGK